MKKILMLFATAMMLICIMTSADKRKPVVFMIGDSTMANKSLKGDNQERGWGQLLQACFNDEIVVDNHALNGRSSKSFIDQGHWQNVLDQLTPGDYVFIQFGHNDEKIKSTDRYTKPGSTFDDNLRRYVNEARAKGAQPVLFNCIVRRIFFENKNAAAEDDLFGKGITLKTEGDTLVETHIIKREDGTIDDYVSAPRRVAEELGVPFVDMNAISKELVQGLGNENSKKLFCWFPANKYEACPKGRQDNTHLNVLGARLMCASVIDAIGEAVPSLKKYIPNSYAPEVNSIRMVKSELSRIPSAAFLDGNTRMKWNYTQGYEQQAYLCAAAQYPQLRNDVYKFVYHFCDTMINKKGEILGYKTTGHQLDHLNAGKMLMLAYDIWPEPRFKLALDSLYSQLSHHPRTSEGGFWHKEYYPHQMWLDGIYMASPFYAEYAKRFLNPEEQKKAYDDVVKQITLVANHTYDPLNGLYRHAWDESHEQRWCVKETGQAPHVWGRAMGWYLMAMVDVLSILPEDYTGRDSILSIFRPVCQRVRHLQDKEFGAWYQVMDQPDRDGNYLETTCTAMFAYTFIKGALNGYLPKDYYKTGVETLEKLEKNFVRHDSDGTISLTRCCAVAGLGGTGRYRDGTFNYYISEPIRDNDAKGVSPYIMAWLLVEKNGKSLK